MISMAVVAGGRDDEAAFEQTFSMDALRIVAQNIMFWNVVDPGHRRSLSMTLSAENRDVHFIGTRSDVCMWENIVIAVTFAAGWSIGSTTFQSAAMNSSIKFLIGFIVTDSAVDVFKPFWMWVFLHIRILMAIDTGGVFVY
jgi:hypothetical protein